jgi:hypothetical protein
MNRIKAGEMEKSFKFNVFISPIPFLQSLHLANPVNPVYFLSSPSLRKFC